MKKHFLLILILSSGYCSAQSNEVFYEQKAFDFYRSTILDTFPVKKKIKVYEMDLNFNPIKFFFSKPNCINKDYYKLNFNELPNYKDEFDDNKSFLNFSNLNKKKFKIKNNGKGSYPRLYISLPHTNNESNLVFVNIYLKEKQDFEIIYHLEFNELGEITNWCKSEFGVIFYTK